MPTCAEVMSLSSPILTKELTAREIKEAGGNLIARHDNNGYVWHEFETWKVYNRNTLIARCHTKYVAARLAATLAECDVDGCEIIIVCQANGVGLIRRR